MYLGDDNENGNKKLDGVEEWEWAFLFGPSFLEKLRRTLQKNVRSLVNT